MNHRAVLVNNQKCKQEEHGSPEEAPPSFEVDFFDEDYASFSSSFLPSISSSSTNIPHVNNNNSSLSVIAASSKENQQHDFFHKTTSVPATASTSASSFPATPSVAAPVTIVKRNTQMLPFASQLINEKLKAMQVVSLGNNTQSRIAGLEEHPQLQTLHKAAQEDDNSEDGEKHYPLQQIAQHRITTQLQQAPVDNSIRVKSQLLYNRNNNSVTQLGRPMDACAPNQQFNPNKRMPEFTGSTPKCEKHEPLPSSTTKRSKRSQQINKLDYAGYVDSEDDEDEKDNDDDDEYCSNGSTSEFDEDDEDDEGDDAIDEDDQDDEDLDYNYSLKSRKIRQVTQKKLKQPKTSVQLQFKSKNHNKKVKTIAALGSRTKSPASTSSSSSMSPPSSQVVVPNQLLSSSQRSCTPFPSSSKHQVLYGISQSNEHSLQQDACRNSRKWPITLQLRPTRPGISPWREYKEVSAEDDLFSAAGHKYLMRIMNSDKEQEHEHSSNGNVYNGRLKLSNYRITMIVCTTFLLNFSHPKRYIAQVDEGCSTSEQSNSKDNDDDSVTFDDGEQDNQTRNSKTSRKASISSSKLRQQELELDCVVLNEKTNGDVSLQIETHSNEHGGSKLKFRIRNRHDNAVVYESDAFLVLARKQSKHHKQKKGPKEDEEAEEEPVSSKANRESQGAVAQQQTKKKKTKASKKQKGNTVEMNTSGAKKRPKLRVVAEASATQADNESMDTSQQCQEHQREETQPPTQAAPPPKKQKKQQI